MSVSVIYACLVTPAIGGSAPGRAVLLSPLLRKTATSLLWVCAFPRRDATQILRYVHMPVVPLLLYSLQWEGLCLVEPCCCLLSWARQQPVSSGSAPSHAVMLSYYCCMFTCSTSHCCYIAYNIRICAWSSRVVVSYVEGHGNQSLLGLRLPAPSCYTTAAVCSHALLPIAVI